MSGLYEFNQSGQPSSIQIELIGGPGDGLFAPVQTTVVLTPTLKGDPEGAVGHGYEFHDDPPRYKYIGLVYESDVNSEDEEYEDEE
jgi:hypothetical protein